jgi:hypothetical protein
MKKQVLYTYLGTNGTITTPIHLEGIYYVRKVRIEADDKKRLTKNGKDFFATVTVADEDVDAWYEVDLIGQK